jgi:hypothetical protein
VHGAGAELQREKAGGDEELAQHWHGVRRVDDVSHDSVVLRQEGSIIEHVGERGQSQEELLGLEERTVRI